MTWYPSATSICSSVSYNKPGIKYVTSGVIWHVLVNCKLSPKLLLWHLSLSDIHAIDAYIFLSLLFQPMLHYFYDAWLSLSLKRTCFLCFSFYLGGLGNFTIRWSSDQHLKHLQGVRSVRLFSGSPAAWYFFLILSDTFETFFWIMVVTSTKSALFLGKIYSLNIFTTTWASVKI